MKLRFLGTGAADWKKGMTDEYRAFTSTMIDDHILIDGTMSIIDSVDTEAITDVLYTHPHMDHFDAEFLCALAPVTAYIHSSWAERAKGLPGVQVVPFECCSAFTVGDFAVTAVPANHLEEADHAIPVHFILQGDNVLFYATDGAWLTTQEWRTLRHFQLDAAVFDATIGDGNPGDYRIFEHNSLDMLRLMLQTLRCPMIGTRSAAPDIAPVLKKDAKVFITHLARTLHPDGRTLERNVEGEFIVTYDGMAVEL